MDSSTPSPAEDREILSRDSVGMAQSIKSHLIFTVGKDRATARTRDWYMASAMAVRDRLVERWMETSRRAWDQDVKRVYYLSMEFLVGRTLSNAALSLGLETATEKGLESLGRSLEKVQEREPDPGLGNGGLGRLAACFLDSLATTGLPGYGYGLRYEFGMFQQAIRDGEQIERPDPWLQGGNPWEFRRPEVVYPVHFGGRVEHRDGKADWVGGETVLAMAHDTIVPGYKTKATNTLRLWSAYPVENLSFDAFNQGDYQRAVEVKNRAEVITRVLYPDDSTHAGKELRLRQEYFFVAASVADILRRFFAKHTDVALLPERIAIHLNDTHPALAVPELMRVLIDEHDCDFDTAWALTEKVFGYTNHTLMPEALETWPVELMGAILPRHLDIILEINKHFLAHVRAVAPGDEDLVRRVSLIDETHGRRVRMAFLSVIASHKVNGVSALHSQLMRETIFADFARLYPDRFINVTNGITPRRWLNQANHGLAGLIDDAIGPAWHADLPKLEGLAAFAEDASMQDGLAKIRLANKQRLAAVIERTSGVQVDPTSLFDCQVKRIHEYKRQLLNLLQVIARWQAIHADPGADHVARTVIFAGKAASSYRMAKGIIRLINDVAAVINADPVTNKKLKMVFLPDYRVSLAEAIIPAADLSEQISTAGTEASGTGNMKFALNGALTIGTEDGANIEIRDAIGADNIFIFGHDAKELDALRPGYHPRALADANPVLRAVLDDIAVGRFSPDEPHRHHAIVDTLLRWGDHYMLVADFAPYLDAQADVDALWRQPGAWAAKSIRSIAGMGYFSSDRAILDYARLVWNVKPVQF